MPKLNTTKLEENRSPEQ